MISLGIICYQGHSSAAALVQDGRVIGAVAEERFTRKKSDDSFPQHSIEYLLKEHHLTIEQIDHVAAGWCPTKTLLGQLPHLHKKSLRFLLEKRAGSMSRSRLDKFLLISNLKNEIRNRFKYQGKFSYVDHHLSHAVSAFIQSGKEDCIVMVADGMGEQASTTIYEFKNHSYKILYRDLFPHSLGIFYSTATQFLGFTPDGDEYKVMGMAAYSQSDKYLEKFSHLYCFVNDHLILNKQFFEIHKKANQFFSFEYAKLFGSVKSEEDKTAFAFALQTHLNKMVVEILKRNQIHFHSSNFASCGGVFLNCLLNQHLRSSGLFKSYSFFPVADDNGTALGAAQFVQWINGKTPMEQLDHLYLGPKPGKLSTWPLPQLAGRKISGLKELALLLADGKILAWAQGRMEFGHRSLGNRSILASPQQKTMKDLLNQKIKMREPFRPFAPSLPENKLHDYFDVKENENQFPFMIETFAAKNKTKADAPAIVHEDGTSRVQTVSQKSNPEFYELLNEFEKLTGCSILLNTSFNINGMPIVNSAEDALECFRQTHIDYLILDDFLIWKV